MPEIIPHDVAMRIAASWHGNVTHHPATLEPIAPTPAINTFSHTGAILPGLLEEIRSLSPARIGSEAVEQVAAWIDYVEHYGVRGPVTGWGKDPYTPASVPQAVRPRRL